MNSKFLLHLLLYFSFLFPLLNRALTSEIERVPPDIKWDPRGYVFYCPCMGKVDAVEVPFVIQRTHPPPFPQPIDEVRLNTIGTKKEKGRKGVSKGSDKKAKAYERYSIYPRVGS